MGHGPVEEIDALELIADLLLKDLESSCEWSRTDRWYGGDFVAECFCKRRRWRNEEEEEEETVGRHVFNFCSVSGEKSVIASAVEMSGETASERQQSRPRELSLLFDPQI